MARDALVAPFMIGRYAIYGEIASGGMATVHLARLTGPGGFTRTVAAKRLLPQLTRNRDFSLMLIDEARIAARISHPNVVSTLDVIATEDELVLVMEYVHGESAARLASQASAMGERVPVRIAAAIVIDTLHGLHAAHEATDTRGRPLNIVHRDVSPQNMLVGVDGVTRVADFGIAKASGRSLETRDGSVKGKLLYMAPEQIENGSLTRATDVFAVSAVFWELLTGRRLFAGQSDGETIYKILESEFQPPSTLPPDLPVGFDEILRRGLARDPDRRYSTAREMALDIERCVEAIRPSEIAAWVERIAADSLSERAQMIAAVEESVHAERGSDAPRGPARPSSGRDDALVVRAAPGSLATVADTPDARGRQTDPVEMSASVS